MKFPTITRYAIILMVLLFASCQEESTVIIEPPVENAFTVNENISTLVDKVVQRDGSYDNIISGASCLSFKLPVTVTVNGEVLVIESAEQFGLVEYLLDEFDDDDDEIIVEFPVTIILADYQEILIDNAEDLEEYIDDCEEGGLDDDIECADFKYPIQLSTYNTVTQQSDVVRLENDKEFFHFLNSQDDDIYMSFIFPLTLILSDGTEETVTNHEMLEDILESVEDDCDEDDDNDYNDDDVDDTEFVSTLIDGKWKITEFRDEEDDRTTEFQDFLFEFRQDGVLVVSSENLTVEGTWNSDGDDGLIELTISLDDVDDPLEDISDDWDVIDFSASQIRLDEDGEETLLFEKE